MAPGGYSPSGYYGSQVGYNITTVYVTTAAPYSNYPSQSYSRRVREHDERKRRETAKAPFPVAAIDAAPSISDVEWQLEEPPRAHEHRAPVRAMATVRGRRPMRGRSGRPHDGITVS